MLCKAVQRADHLLARLDDILPLEITHDHLLWWTWMEVHDFFYITVLRGVLLWSLVLVGILRAHVLYDLANLLVGLPLDCFSL